MGLDLVGLLAKVISTMLWSDSELNRVKQDSRSGLFDTTIYRADYFAGPWYLKCFDLRICVSIGVTLQHLLSRSKHGVHADNKELVQTETNQPTGSVATKTALSVDTVATNKVNLFSL